jgi:hypothetical protein
LKFLGHSNSSTFTSDLSDESRKRLTIASLLYAIAFLLAYALPRILGGDPVGVEIDRTVPDRFATLAIP